MKPQGGHYGSGFGSDKMVSEPGEPDVLLTGFVVLLRVLLSGTSKKKNT